MISRSASARSPAGRPDAAADDDVFDALRPRLFGIAYGMLGSRADAEDVLQDAWLRWHRTDRAGLRSAEAWLITVVSRLAIDRLRAAKVEREAYVGSWLPEPLVEFDTRTPEAAAELASELSMAFLWVLERLAPEERAAFLLRQVFEHDYADIAALLARSEAACRQMVHRAAERVRQERPRFDVTREAHQALLERFMQAARSGHDGLKALLADEVQLVADGGGKIRAAFKLVCGAHRIAKLYAVTSRRLGERLSYRLVEINGEPGLLRFVDGALESAQSFVTDGRRIMAIYVVRNPDKLANVSLSS